MGGALINCHSMYCLTCDCFSSIEENESVLIPSIKVCFKVNYLTRHSFWCKNFQNRWENKKVMGNLM